MHVLQFIVDGTLSQSFTRLFRKCVTYYCGILNTFCFPINVSTFQNIAIPASSNRTLLSSVLHCCHLCCCRHVK